MPQIPGLSSSSQPRNEPESQESDPHVPASIPPWTHLNSSASDEKAPFLPNHNIVPNTRHYKPPPKYEVGRKWDKYREHETALISAPIPDHQTRWIPFMQSGPNPQETREDGIVRPQSWMEANMPVCAQKWEEEDDLRVDAQGDGLKGFTGLMYRGKWLISPERQEKTVRIFWRLLLKNAFVPLGFRITVLAYSAAGLGIGATILRNVNHVNDDLDPNNQCATQASTYMAIIVGAVAMPYVGYVTYDEYFNKPLGLRSVNRKMFLLLSDLYFIVFSASNLTLALNALLDQSWACYDESYEDIGSISIPVPRTCPNNASICSKQRALSGVLVVSLVAWLLCFSISVLRVVEKLRLEY
ncbi:hypothetical protein BST61_czeina64g000270 [Lecanosticta acicola]|uniref:Uncharacterized protein n=1 Tax=Lecanosticta acicola TaxID=111012 RepID=A0AAI9EDF3_9PEZI|nr:hypothetical protein BST61_czeina64g000270 [Lecanosticta acicola]